VQHPGTWIIVGTSRSIIVWENEYDPMWVSGGPLK
jgi:hypothetical protein